jgi:NAD(P)-dependent dehydrogenase (short-subunit alcohol dehydrogenase family)
MSENKTVLLLGGTGRTGGRVLQQLLARGVNVRAIVRSAGRLPEGAAADPALTVIEADVLSMDAAELRRSVTGCDAVISCLGHNISLRGVFGPPHDLVTKAVSRVCDVSGTLRPAQPVEFILMSTVSVNRPGGLDTRRGRFEKGAVAVLRALVPPAKDNQAAADFLYRSIGAADPFVRWVAVRPDTLREGDVTEYTLHEGLVSSLAKPDETNMANVAHFMCELVVDPALFAEWAGKMPVIINSVAK